MNKSSLNTRTTSVGYLITEQHSHVDNQQYDNSIQNQSNSMRFVKMTNQMQKPSMTPTPLEYSWCSNHPTATAVYAFSLFTSIVIISGVLIICLTSQKATDQLCQSNFQVIKDVKPAQYNSNPRSIAVGDFNHDNFLDIVVVNSGTNNIGIFLNNGDGIFASQNTFATEDNSRPLSVVVGDFNNDHHLDIAVTNYNIHNIGLFIGYGDGTFASIKTFSTGISRPVSIAAGDFNNDHCLDIVVTNNGTNNIAIFFGYGNGSFGNQTTYSTGYDSLPYFVVVNDFNNDHYLDIAVANYGTNNIGVFLGYGNGRFTKQTIYSTGPQSNPYSIAVNDIDHDGQVDIVVANSGTHNISIFFSFGNGTFASQKTYSISPISRSYSIGIGDFNQDNQWDIAVSNYNTNNICILTGYGNRSFATPTMHSTGSDSNPSGMIVADFDNDNRSDIALVNSNTNNVLVFIGYRMMESKNPTIYSTGLGSTPVQIVIGDFDNDTQFDLAVLNSGTNNIGIFLGYGNGSFREQTTYSTGNNSHPYAFVAHDMDDDHRLDIIVANSNIESLGILYGYSNGTFTTVVTYFTGNFSYPISVTVDDFNNDNHFDIAFADYNTNSIGIVLGYGNRSFGNPVGFPSGDNSRPYFIVAGDFNNDGQSDIAVANIGTDNIAIFVGSGNGTFTLFTIYSTGDASQPWMLTIADLNNDNHLDIIVANSGTINVGVFFGFGNGSFGTQLTYSTVSGSCPYWISVADFNNDHSLDLAIAHGYTNIGVFFGDSYGYFSDEIVYMTGPNTASMAIAVADFNNDTQLDVAIANFATDNVAILLGHPSKVSTNRTVNVNNTDSQSSSVTLDNLNDNNQSISPIAHWTTDDVPVLLGDYYADFQSQETYSTGSSFLPYSIAVGDLNNDTYMDIVIANSGNETIGILLGYYNETFAPEMIRSIGIGSSPRHVLIDDFNKDKQMDVAVTDIRNDRIIVLVGNGDGTFPTEMIYSTGPESNPSTLAIGDFTNDNYLDLIVTNKGTDTIGIFFGYNYTSFSRQNPCELEDNSRPVSVAIGDFNNDGHLDIVSALYLKNHVGVFLGYGNGTFTPVMIYSDVHWSHPWSVAVGDFNKDTYLDIVVSNWGTNTISVLLGYGNGSFTKPMLYSTGFATRPISIAVGDFNNDNFLDITTANYGGNSISVFLGYRNGTFQNVSIFPTGRGSSPRSVTVANINNDTQLDIIVANAGTNNVGIFLGYGNGSFADQLIFLTGADSFSTYATAGDFNKDGRLDLAIANYGTSNVGILYGYGNGTFGNLQKYETGIGSRPFNLCIGDFNNDNQLDIIVTGISNQNIGIFFGYSDGTFASMSAVSTGEGSSAYGIAIGDFNNDSRLDFTIADVGNNQIGVFLASGSKPFGGQTTFFIGNDSHPSSVAVGHFNNDSYLDIAIANYGTNNIGILLGYGNKMFSNITTYSMGDDSHPLSVAIGDFNNDSQTDIVVANSETDNIVVLIGYGNGSFSTFMNYSTGYSSQPVSIAVGDFNRDYQLDIAVANFGTNNVCLLFGCGNGTFTNHTWYSLGYDSRPNWIVFKDLNNDGWEDIVVATYGIDNIKILLNLC